MSTPPTLLMGMALIFFYTLCVNMCLHVCLLVYWCVCLYAVVCVCVVPGNVPRRNGRAAGRHWSGRVPQDCRASLPADCQMCFIVTLPGLNCTIGCLWISVAAPMCYLVDVWFCCIQGCHFPGKKFGIREKLRICGSWKIVHILTIRV